jgi:hypothetical protein
MVKRAIYTAIAGGKDKLFQVPSFSNVDFICYTDDKSNIIPPWQYKPISAISKEPVRNAKQYKLQPHVFLTDYDETIWMDANFKIKKNPFEVFDKYDNLLMLFSHFERGCLYNEAQVCSDWKLDKPNIIAAKVKRYKAEGFPENFGLTECGLMFRRKSPLNDKFFDLWWGEVQNGSKRDQLSFMYCVWKLNHPVKIFSETARVNDYFEWNSHLK